MNLLFNAVCAAAGPLRQCHLLGKVGNIVGSICLAGKLKGLGLVKRRFPSVLGFFDALFDLCSRGAEQLR